MEVKAEVDIRLPNMQRLAALPSTDSRVVRLLKRIGRIYREFAQRRFRANAAGGGQWPPLAPSTIRARAQKEAKVSKATKEKLEKVRASRRAAGLSVIAGGSQAVLIDTGLMVQGLDADLNTRAGATEEVGDFQITVGYGGTTRHPAGGPTIHDLVVWNQEGAGHLPVRTIMPLPGEMPATFQDQCREEAEKTLAAIAGEGS